MHGDDGVAAQASTCIEIMDVALGEADDTLGDVIAARVLAAITAQEALVATQERARGDTT